MSISPPDFIPYRPTGYPPNVVLQRAQDFYRQMNARRSCRHFSDSPVPKAVVEQLIKTASTAPSGAHKQPWTFAAVSDPNLKRRIRQGAEAEERAFYQERATEAWLRDLAPLGTNANKEFLETAPWLLVVFRQNYPAGMAGKEKNYYVQESVGIACGILIAAIHLAGLCTLTHTPSPMNFLSDILARPKNEKPFLLLPLGYPAAMAQVPNLQRKPLAEVACFYEAQH